MRNKIDNDTLKQIKDDLRLYFDFLELYNKPRRPMIQAKIDEFVKKESSIMRRIRYIEELDIAENKKSKQQKTREEEEVISVKPSKNKKKKLRKNSFISYFFGDRKAIKSFGERVNTIKLKFFGLIKSISSESNIEWTKYRNDIDAILYKPFSYIVSNGWRHLDRIHYNVSTAFAGFLSCFVKNSKPLRKKEYQLLITIFEECLPNYLQVVTRPEYKKILVESMEATLPKISAAIDNSRLVLPFLEELINTSTDKISFINIVLSVYMLHYNKFIDLNTLSSYFKLPKINSDRYNLNTKLLSSVKKEIKRAKESFNKANKDLFYIKYIDQHLNLDSDKQNDIVRAINRVATTDRNIETIDLVDNPFASNPFAYLKEDIVGVMLRFFSGFLMTYKDVLVDYIYVKTGNLRKKVRLFEPEIFTKEITEIEQSIKNYADMKQASEFSTITYATYMNFLDRVRPSSEKEDRLCHFTEIGINALLKIREKLTEIMYNHFHAKSLKGEELLDAQKISNDSIDLVEENQPRFLPYSNDTVIINRYHESKRVESLINEIIILTSNLAFLFQEDSTLSVIEKEDELLKRCEESLYLISKLA